MLRCIKAETVPADYECLQPRVLMECKPVVVLVADKRLAVGLEALNVAQTMVSGRSDPFVHRTCIMVTGVNQADEDELLVA